MTSYFSLNAFLLGALLFLCLYLSNVLFSLLCLFWKIRVIKFSIFADPWFHLYNEYVLGTQFILGWLPITSYIQPLGFIDDAEERKKFKSEDLPYAFFNKPKYLKIIFRFVPAIVWLLAFLISVLILGGSNFIAEFNELINYLINAINTMFFNNETNERFIEQTKEILDGKNIIVFSFSFLVIAMLIFTPFNSIMQWFSNDDKKTPRLQKIIGFIVFILILWLYLWKIPRFLFSFFTFSQSLIFVSSFLIGMFSGGIVLFFTTLYIVKSISQTLNENRFNK